MSTNVKYKQDSHYQSVHWFLTILPKNSQKTSVFPVFSHAVKEASPGPTNEMPQDSALLQWLGHFPQAVRSFPGFGCLVWWTTLGRFHLILRGCQKKAETKNLPKGLQFVCRSLDRTGIYKFQYSLVLPSAAKVPKCNHVIYSDPPRHQNIFVRCVGGHHHFLPKDARKCKQTAASFQKKSAKL